MRLLVYGMQSSGATAFTRMLAERPNCVALVDIPNNYAAPHVVTTADFVAKVVITTAYSLAEHVKRFCPDRTVLFLRNPCDNYESLRTKSYRNYSGLMEEKFALLDQVFAARERFDAVIAYEDFVARHRSVFSTMTKLGWEVTEEHYRFRRTYNELLSTLWGHAPELQESMEVVFGNVRGAEVTAKWRDKHCQPETETRLKQLCPRLLAYYRARPEPA